MIVSRSTDGTALICMGVHTYGQMESADLPWKNGWKIKNRKHAKKSSFLCLCYILIAIRSSSNMVTECKVRQNLHITTTIRAGRCRERRYADHICIQLYFRLHHFVVKFTQISWRQEARGHWPPNQNPADDPADMANHAFVSVDLLILTPRGRTVGLLVRRNLTAGDSGE